MEHDVIILYLIAGVSFTFALFNCILFALKHGKTMKTDGMIVSIKSTNPTNEKWRNAKLAEVSYLVNGKRIVSKNRIQVSLTSEIGTHIPIRYDRNQPDKIYSKTNYYRIFNWCRQHTYSCVYANSLEKGDIGYATFSRMVYSHLCVVPYCQFDL